MYECWSECDESSLPSGWIFYSMDPNTIFPKLCIQMPLKMWSSDAARPRRWQAPLFTLRMNLLFDGSRDCFMPFYAAGLMGAPVEEDQKKIQKNLDKYLPIFEKVKTQLFCFRQKDLWRRKCIISSFSAQKMAGSASCVAAIFKSQSPGTFSFPRYTSGYSYIWSRICHCCSWFLGIVPI